MSNVIQKHVQEVLVEQTARVVMQRLKSESANQAAIARTGSPDPTTPTGFYDAEGRYRRYEVVGDPVGVYPVRNSSNL
ncbi:MAG: hypothetical protein JO316_15635 [Abitibacteriaceae bacterium]|nr:hypothetical protein [Abditibacteriaceae bacterium]